MALKPEYSVMGGLATAALVFSIYQNSVPSQADIRALPAGTPDIEHTERRATWLSAGVVSAVSLLAKDPTIFVMGSAMTVAMAFWTRHSNYTESSGATYLSKSQQAAAGTEQDGPEMMETKPAQMFGGNHSEFAR